MATLRFGTSGEVSFDNEQSVRKANAPSTTRASLPNIQSAVSHALQEPIEFPPLQDIVLSDDVVVLPLQPGLPCVSDLVAGVVSAVMESGVPPELIRLLRAPYDSVSKRQLLSCLDRDIAERLTVLEHDAEDREGLSFLGASKADHPIYVNREIADAGFVLPIGFQGARQEIFSSWFPTFSDKETQTRFHKAMTNSGKASKRGAQAMQKHLQECEEVSWMTGIQFVLELVPAGDDQALHILAGLPTAVSQRAHALFEEAWQVAVDEPAQLVVAGIGGGPDQQTWENVAGTVDRLLDAVEVDGAIAICSQLKTKPGPALRRLASAQDFEATQKAIRRTATHDAQAASQLHRALQRVRVYLLSDLPENHVDNLGIAFVSNVEEISKLSSRFDKCLAFENAQHISIARSLP